MNQYHTRGNGNWKVNLVVNLRSNSVTVIHVTLENGNITAQVILSQHTNEQAP